MRPVGRPAVVRRCPICGWRGLRFRRAPGTVRNRSTCPRCASQQRHRHLWLWLTRESTLLSGAPLDVLHFAPEAGIERRLRAASPPLRYRTADLDPRQGADAVLDLQALALADDSVDVVLCSHVLEHVSDDSAALRELHRVLRPGGWGVLQTPVNGLVTVEEQPGDDPALRRARFGQDDHVRIYGRDYLDRLGAAGFEAEALLYRDQMPRTDLDRFGLRYDLRAEHGVDFDALDEPWEIWRVKVPATAA
jgi:SAM-dependent methyltransferase